MNKSIYNLEYIQYILNLQFKFYPQFIIIIIIVYCTGTHYTYSVPLYKMNNIVRRHTTKYV